jgi:hypothetical protein
MPRGARGKLLADQHHRTLISEALIEYLELKDLVAKMGHELQDMGADLGLLATIRPRDRKVIEEVADELVSQGD